jgi:hypothetical protein
VLENVADLSVAIDNAVVNVLEVAMSAPPETLIVKGTDANPKKGFCPDIFTNPNLGTACASVPI